VVEPASVPSMGGGSPLVEMPRKAGGAAHDSPTAGGHSAKQPGILDAMPSSQRSTKSTPSGPATPAGSATPQTALLSSSRLMANSPALLTKNAEAAGRGKLEKMT